MLKLEPVQTDKHSTSNLLRRKNLRSLRSTNQLQNRCVSGEKKATAQIAHLVFCRNTSQHPN